MLNGWPRHPRVRRDESMTCTSRSPSSNTSAEEPHCSTTTRQRINEWSKRRSSANTNRKDIRGQGVPDVDVG